jgi:crossover junction endodeoxyribonuclease RuvC
MARRRRDEEDGEPRPASEGPVVLGVDPGSLITGYGLLADHDGEVQLVEFGTLRPRRRTDFPGRLADIYDGLCDLIDETQPDEIAVESCFHHKNARSALVIGHVRGVILLAAAQSGARVFEYTPVEVKLAVAGSGAATKHQVQFMVERLLTADVGKPSPDEADALAVALCHLHRRLLIETMT